MSSKPHELTFSITGVLRLAQHALGAEKHTYGYDVLFMDDMHKGGRTKMKDGWPDKQNIDQSKIGPNLILVKDRGVYLMSGGEPKLPVGSNVAYARECNPKELEFDVWYEAARRIMGGDDTVVTMFGLPQQVVEAASMGATALVLGVTPDRIEISFTPPAPRPTLRQRP